MRPFGLMWLLCGLCHEIGQSCPKKNRGTKKNKGTKKTRTTVGSTWTANKKLDARHPKRCPERSCGLCHETSQSCPKKNTGTKKKQGQDGARGACNMLSLFFLGPLFFLGSLFFLDPTRGRTLSGVHLVSIS